MTRPLAEVLARSFGDFTPQHPSRHPWTQPSHRPVEHAYTGITHIIPLGIADRVHLIGVDRPTTLQDWTEPEDRHTGSLGCKLPGSKPSAPIRPRHIPPGGSPAAVAPIRHAR